MITDDSSFQSSFGRYRGPAINNACFPGLVPQSRRIGISPAVAGEITHTLVSVNGTKSGSAIEENFLRDSRPAIEFARL